MESEAQTSVNTILLVCAVAGPTIAAVAMAFGVFFRSPKDLGAERRAQEERHRAATDQRIVLLEQNYTSTAVEQAKTTEAVKNLTDAIKELRTEIRDMRLGGGLGSGPGIS